MDSEKTQRLIKIFGPAFADVATDLKATTGEVIAALLFLGVGLSRSCEISKGEVQEIVDRLYDLSGESVQ